MSQAEYLHLFIEESFEHLQNINDGLLQLEKTPNELKYVEEIFRSAHTLKGMAATMEYRDITNLTHTMENLLDAIRHQQLILTDDTVDILFQSSDVLEEMVQNIVDGGNGQKEVDSLVTQLEQMSTGNVKAKPPVSSESKNEWQSLSYNEFERAVIEQSAEQGFQAYEIHVKVDESAVLKAVRAFMVLQRLESHGELIKSVPTSEELENEAFEDRFVLTFVSKESDTFLKKTILEISEIADVDIREAVIVNDGVKKEKPSTSESEQPTETAKAEGKKMEVAKTVRINLERLDTLMNLFEELVIDRSRLEGIAASMNDPELTNTVERLSRTSGHLQEVILSMRMMPVESVFNRFPSMVRKLSKELGKSIKIEITGAQTELDRSIIDEIGDPLVHLLRNSIDHGVESTDERKRVGKKEAGTVKLNAYHSGNHVYIEVSDDGAGINKEKVAKSCIKNGRVTEAEVEQMSDNQMYQLLFEPGFSTAEQITDVSGRGVGLDVVKQTFESLGGKITVSSQEGEGSKFSIQLPLTLSIIDIMMVQADDEKYGIPISSIIETAMVRTEDIYMAQGQHVMNFRNHVIPVLFLKDVFSIPDRTKSLEETTFEDDFQSIIIVKNEQSAAAIAVETLIGQQDVVLKSLGNYLGQVKGISGATILGNGEIALIADTDSLFQP